MSAGLVSVLAVTIGFCALVYWVFRPGSDERMDADARIPFDDEEGK